MTRTLNVVRMQLANRETYIWVPLIVLGGAFVISFAIWAMLETSGVEGVKYGGGAQAPLWYFAVVGAQALARVFPFSQAMSVTRREFYLGTILTAALTSLMLAVIFIVGGLVEHATNGFGVNGYFFALDWLWLDGPVIAGFFYFAMAMLFFIVGFAGAAVYKRFGNVWLTVAIIGVALLLIGGLWVIGMFDAWGPFFGWFATSGPGMLALIMAGVAAVLAAVSFPVLRRAVP
ncbi:hypothetical protein [Microbacterium sp. GXF7504]